MHFQITKRLLLLSVYDNGIDGDGIARSIDRSIRMLDDTTSIQVVSHRGANNQAPENTNAAAQLCIDLGVDFLEVDVRTSSDGVMYNIHDVTSERTTDGSGYVHEMSSAELDSLDAGSWFAPRYSRECIPRLESLSYWIKGKIKVFFDVKSADLKKLIVLVRESNIEDECFFWFKNRDQALRFRELAPDLALKINESTPDGVARAKVKFDPQIIECDIDRLTDEMLNACHQNVLKLMVRVEGKDKTSFRRIIKAGVDMANVDYPADFLKVKKSI